MSPTPKQHLAAALSVANVFLSTILLSARDEDAAAKTTHRSLNYKSTPQAELRLQARFPAGHKATDKRPAVIFFFGGGWVSGKTQQFAKYTRRFSEAGYVAMAAEYRVRNKHGGTTPFHCVEDGKSAVRWVREHAEELGIDPDKVIAGGGSAGGHVAACCAMVEGYEAKGENKEISSVPDALLLYNPVVDTTERGYGSDKFSEETKTMLSPCHLVREALPPTLIVHGTADKTGPFENVERFERLMKEAGNTCKLIPFEGRRHGFFNSPGFKSGTVEDFTAILKASYAFLAEHGLAADAPR